MHFKLLSECSNGYTSGNDIYLSLASKKTISKSVTNHCSKIITQKGKIFLRKGAIFLNLLCNQNTDSQLCTLLMERDKYILYTAVLVFIYSALEQHCLFMGSRDKSFACRNTTNLLIYVKMICSASEVSERDCI
jgi:hypothetical protein